MSKHEGNEESNKTSEELRAELDQTRERVSEDVEALGNKLSPENLKAEAKQAVSRTLEQGTEAVREKWQQGTQQLRRSVQRGTSQVKERVESAETSVLSFARENPIPLALIGAGLGLLWYNRARATPRAMRPDPAVVGRGGVYEDFDDDHRNWDRTGTIDKLRDRARGGVASVRHAASDAAHHARERVDQLEDQAKAGAERAKRAAERTLNDKPLVLGAVALGAGLCAGLSIPATDSENQLVGRYRDQLLGSVKQRIGLLESKAEGAMRDAAESLGSSVEAQAAPG